MYLLAHVIRKLYKVMLCFTEYYYLFSLLWCRHFRSVVLTLFHCWDPLNATDVVWDPQVKIEKVCAPE